MMLTKGLHTQGCTFTCVAFLLVCVEILYARAFQATRALYMPWLERQEYGIRTALKCRLNGRDKTGKKGDFLRGGDTGGVTFLEKWGYKTLVKPSPVERLPANKIGLKVQETDTFDTTFRPVGMQKYLIYKGIQYIKATFQGRGTPAKGYALMFVGDVNRS